MVGYRFMEAMAIENSRETSRFQEMQKVVHSN
jgi:hypothetical protein